MTSISSPFPYTTTHLQRLESGLMVRSTTGIRTFVTARGMFPGHFSEYFRSLKTNIPSEARPATSADLYEMKADGNFKDLLKSLKLNPDLLFWRSQDQILTCFETHLKHLDPDVSEIFFPFIVKKKRFVAGIGRDERRLKASANLYDYRDYMGPRIGSLLVLLQPQLAPTA